jgi:hypothetical protein
MQGLPTSLWLPSLMANAEALRSDARQPGMIVAHRKSTPFQKGGPFLEGEILLCKTFLEASRFRKVQKK